MQFIAFDIETTGFLPRVDQIVEIAAVRFNGSQVVNTYSSLVNPKISIPSQAAAIHGITDEMVQSMPTINDVLEKFAEFCANDVMVAHNAPFDTEFIKADIEKYETSAPSGIILDSCSMARKVLPGSPNYKLGTLVSHFNLPGDKNFHRAEADSRFCGHLFALMIEKVFKSGEPVVIENLMNLSGPQKLKFPQIVKSYRQMDLLAEL